MSIVPKIYPDAEPLIADLVEQFKQLSHFKRPIHISLSGGRTPARLFSTLAQPQHADAVLWQYLHLWWGDERCVAPQSEQSNYGVTKQLLLDRVAIPAENIHRIRGECEPQAEAERFAAEMQQCLPSQDGYPVFDWILLGIGNDGHTASLFPGHTDYSESALAVVAAQPETGQLRISKTVGVLNAARRLSYLALGEDKAEIIQQLVTQPATELSYPAAQIASASGVTEYLIDAQAASLIA